ncbi:PIN domain-containing protein [soil metagenome]
MKVGIDTNVLIYAASGDDGRKRDIAQALLRAIKPDDVCFASQVAGEFYNVSVKKLKRAPESVSATLEVWSQVYGFRGHGQTQMLAAMELSRDHNFQIWDALILTIAADDGCRLFLTEDLHEGFRYRGVTIVNPFAERLHPLLASLLDSLPPMSPAGAP